MYHRSVYYNTFLFTVICPSLIIIQSSSVVYAQFVESPVTTTAYLGDNASFHCTTDGNHLLVWIVNGIEARMPVIRNRGITFERFGINSEMSTLTTLASIQNNNSEIICIQENLITGQEIARTLPAYLYVQGTLQPYDQPGVSSNLNNNNVIILWYLYDYIIYLDYNIDRFSLIRTKWSLCTHNVICMLKHVGIYLL